MEVAAANNTNTVTDVEETEESNSGSSSDIADNDDDVLEVWKATTNDDVAQQRDNDENDNNVAVDSFGNKIPTCSKSLLTLFTKLKVEYDEQNILTRSYGICDYTTLVTYSKKLNKV